MKKSHKNDEEYVDVTERGEKSPLLVYRMWYTREHHRQRAKDGKRNSLQNNGKKALEWNISIILLHRNWWKP